MTDWNFNRVWQLRKTMQLSRENFAKKFPVSVTTVYRWESRMSIPSQTHQEIIRRLEQRWKNK